MVQNKDITHFLSLHLYPQGNVHFHGDSTHMGAVEYYRHWLGSKGRNTWTAVTFEELFQVMEEKYTDPESRKWVNYLKERYLY